MFNYYYGMLHMTGTNFECTSCGKQSVDLSLWLGNNPHKRCFWCIKYPPAKKRVANTTIDTPPPL